MDTENQDYFEIGEEKFYVDNHGENPINLRGTYVVRAGQTINVYEAIKLGCEVQRLYDIMNGLGLTRELYIDKEDAMGILGASIGQIRYFLRVFQSCLEKGREGLEEIIDIICDKLGIDSEQDVETFLAKVLVLVTKMKTQE